MSEYLFSYGTLQKQEVQIKLFGRELDGSADTLNSYKIATIEIKDEAFLSKGDGKYQSTLIFTGDKGDRVNGTVLGLTKDELSLADKYEPRNYKRTQVMLASGKEAWIYVAAENDW